MCVFHSYSVILVRLIASKVCVYVASSVCVPFLVHKVGVCVCVSFLVSHVASSLSLCVCSIPVSFVSQACVWFGLMFYVPVNSYGYVETVSSPNHTFFCVSLTKQLTSTSCNTFTCI